MYDTALFEQFIKDIRVTDLGQKVVIDCLPSAPFDNDEVYQFVCLKCEKITINCREQVKNYIAEYGCIDLIEFSVSKQENNKIGVYIYGRGVLLDVLCQEIEIIK